MRKLIVEEYEKTIGENRRNIKNVFMKIIKITVPLDVYINLIHNVNISS